MSEDKKRFRIVLQRMFETYKPEHNNYRIKEPMHSSAHRYPDLNKNEAKSLRYERATVGRWTVYDSAEGNRVVYECYCIENEGPSSKKSGSDLRIEPGDYHIAWHNTTVWLPTVAKYGKMTSDELFPPMKRGEKNTTRGLITIRPNENNKIGANGFITTFGAHAGRGVMIHLGRMPQHSEACLLLTEKLDEKKNPETGKMEYTGTSIRDHNATIRAVVNFYKLVVQFGPHQFLLQVVESGDPPPPPYETEKPPEDEEGYGGADDDDFDPTSLPPLERLKEKLNTKNGYYDLLIEF